MLANSTKKLILGNIDLLNYCQTHSINIEKLNKCNIEKMGDEFMFVLDKENVPKSSQIIPLDIDIETQPDIVLIVSISDCGIQIETTNKTRRLLNV